MRALGAAGEALIKSFEKLRFDAYLDEAGVWTAGWGHTGVDVQEGVTCSAEQAEVWFADDTAKAVHAVNQSLMPTAAEAINQNQFDALVSFTYNVGVGAEAHSTLLKYVNARAWNQAAEEFGKWIRSGGHVSVGLMRRRAAERALFLTP